MHAVVDSICRRMRGASKWWSGRPVGASGTVQPGAGTKTCRPSPASTTSRAPCRISSASTTALRPGTPSVVCRRARDAAIRLAATASQATSYIPAFALAAMGMTRALGAFRRRLPWVTRVSIGQPRLSTALKRCTSLLLATGVVWTAR